MEGRVQITMANGRCVALPPKSAHLYLERGWARIAPDDAESHAVYDAYREQFDGRPITRGSPFALDASEG